MLDSNTEKLINNSADKYGLDRNKFKALILSESGGANVKNDQGYIGPGQLGPEVIKDYKVKNPYDPAENIDASAHFLSDLVRRSEGDYKKGILKYKGAYYDTPQDVKDKLYGRYEDHLKRLGGETGSINTSQPTENKPDKMLDKVKKMAKGIAGKKVIGLNDNAHAQIGQTAKQVSTIKDRLDEPYFLAVLIVLLVLFVFTTYKLMIEVKKYGSAAIA